MGPVALVLGGLQLAQGIAGYEQNKNAANQATALANYNVQNIENQKQATLTTQRRQLLLASGSATAQASASGASLDSYDDVMNDNYQQGLLSQAMTEYNSTVAEKSEKYGGAVKAQDYKNSATSSLLKGISGAASTAYSSPSTSTNVSSINWNSSLAVPNDGMYYPGG